MPQPTVTCQFQALLTTFPGLLFSFRSRYYFAIGFEEYLVLEVGDPQDSRENSNPRYSRLHQALFAYAYGTVTPYGASFQMTSASRQGTARWAYNTTSPLRDSV